MRALLDLIAPLEASLDFPEEGYHFITPDESRAQRSTRSSTISTRCWPTRRADA